MTHGKPSTYNLRGCRCDACTEAWRRRQAEYRSRARTGGAIGPQGKERDPAKQHGASAYLNYGCRCAVCREGKAQSARDYRARQKRGA